MIPAELTWLFWDVDPATIDLERHRDYVIERIMARGNWEAMRWLIRNVESEALADFLRRKGHRLAPRERAFWSLIADVPYEPAPGGGAPHGRDERSKHDHDHRAPARGAPEARIGPSGPGFSSTSKRESGPSPGPPGRERARCPTTMPRVYAGPSAVRGGGTEPGSSRDR